jgi:DUF4097 and DUF4098 domain-containing protein YvlB
VNRSQAPRRRPRIVVALAAITLLSTAACSGTIATTQASDTVEKSLQTSATQIDVEMFNGTIEAAAGPEGAVSATVKRTGTGANETEALADAQKIDVTLAMEGDRAVLRAVYTPNPSSPDRRGASAVVTVPAGSVLVLRTSNGSIAVTGITGTVVADTSNAGVTATGPLEALRVKTSNGKVVVAQGGGLLTLETSNGAIDVGATDAVVEARTSNGKITFAGSLAAGTSRLRTSNATIDLTLPADAAFSVDAQTSNAKIVTDFAVTGGSTSDDRLTGAAGGGGDTTIILETSNNPITISSGS